MKYLNQTWTFYATASQFATGDAYDATGDVTYKVYEPGSDTPLLTGTMALKDGDNTVGFYEASVVLSAANGFEAGKDYVAHITAIVGGVSGHDKIAVSVQLDPLAALQADIDLTRKMVTNLFIKVGELMTLYDDDGVTPLKTQVYERTADGYVRGAAQDA